MKTPSPAHRLALTIYLLFLAAVFCPTAFAQTNPLQLTVKATPDPVRPGEKIQYVFTASNNGTAALTNVEVDFRIPNHTTVPYYSAGANVGLGIGNLPPGQSRTATAYVMVDAADPSTGATAPPDGTVITVSAVASNSSFSTTTSVDVKVAANPAFNVTVSANEPNFTTPGATLAYTVRYGNTGAASAGALLRVPLPAGTSLLSASDGGSLGGDGVVQWNVGALAAGQSGTRTLSLAVNASLSAGSPIAALAEIHDGANPGNGARGSAYTVLRSSTLLGLTIKATPDAVQPGQNIIYTFTATNHSTAALTNVEVDFRIPNHTTVPYYSAGANVGLGIGNLPPGQSRTATAYIALDAADPSTGATAPPDGTIVHLDASAVGSEGFSADASLDITVNAAPAFSVDISPEDPDAVAPGAALAYTVRYGNTGAASAGALLRVPLPAGTSLLSASDGGSLGGDGVVQWNVGALAAGQSGTRTLSLAVNASLSAGSPIAALAEVRDAASGSSLAHSSTVAVVRTLVLLSLSVAAAPDTTVQPGGTINYTFTATNHNSTAFTNVDVYFRLPVNTTAPYYSRAAEVGVGIGNLPPGQSRTGTFSITVDAPDASTGTTAPPDGTLVHLDARADSSETFTAVAVSNVTVSANTHPAYFTGEVALNNGVYYLAFPNGDYFGYYSYLTDPHYLYHFDLGYEYLFDAADGKSGVYLYDFASDTFFYTSPTFPFPYLYDFTLNTVLYYYPSPNNPGHYNTDGYRFFYRFDNGQIIVK